MKGLDAMLTLILRVFTSVSMGSVIITDPLQGELETKIGRRISGAILVMAVSLPVLAGDPVGITPDLMSVTVMDNGAATEIVSNQGNAH